MTKELAAGRDLDALIAEQVFGLCTGKSYYVSVEEYAEEEQEKILDEWIKKYQTNPPQAYIEDEARDRACSATSGDYGPRKCGKCKGKPHPEIKYYSTSIADAWLVVEKLATMGFHFELEDGACDAKSEGPGKIYGADFQHYEMSKRESVWSGSHSAPHAICLAALKAVGYMHE